MRVPFYKSLDREFEFFGIKGRWVTIVLVGAGASLALSLVVGSILGTGMGIAVAVILIAIVFFGTVTLQVKTPSRRVDKTFLSKKMSGWVVRRETLSMIVNDDPLYEEVKASLRRLREEPSGTNAKDQ